MLNICRREIFFQAAALCCALGLGLEYLLQVKFSASLCGTQACKVVGDFLQLGFLGEEDLVLLGFLFFVVLFGLSCLPCRFRGYGWSVIWVLLIGALAFDGALMGYQAAVPAPFCLLCASVAVGLVVVLAGACWRDGFHVAFLLGLAVWFGAFAGNSILDHTKSVAGTPGMEEAAFAQEVHGDASDDTKYYLFFSLDCRHCSEVLLNLARVRPQGSWSLACIDRAPADLEKLASALARKDGGENLFAQILRAKAGDFEAGNFTPEDAPAKIRNATQKAVACFQAMNLPGVPALVVEKPNGVRMSFPGTRNIAHFLEEQGVLDTWRSF